MMAVIWVGRDGGGGGDRSLQWWWFGVSRVMGLGKKNGFGVQIYSSTLPHGDVFHM